VAANSAPCGQCPLCRAGRSNLCEDLLFVNGAYGEYIALPPRLVERNVVRLAAGTPAARAAFAEPLACALLGLERGRLEAGQTVAIFGHGPLGCLLAMLAVARKARVVLVGKRGWRLDRVRQLDLGDAIDTARVADPADEVRRLTGGRGADVTVDATGRPEAWEQAIASVGRGGTVVLFGGCAPGTTVRLDTRRAHYDELTLVGAFHHTPELIRRAVELAGPRGFCAGVERAIDIVELALAVCPPPVYVRKEIVHNRHVVDELRQKGAIFVDELDEVPDDATVIFSAHGISPEVREEARRRGLRVIDATCPLVTKVHLEAIRYAREGYTIILVGHEDHDEVIGTMGEAPSQMLLIERPDQVVDLQVPDSNKVAYLTQTTLSVDDTRECIEALRQRFPKIVGP